METKNDTSGVFVLRQDLKPMEERHLEQNYPKHIKERGGGISARRTITVWSKVVSGNWIQKAVWNRMVTTLERDQVPLNRGTGSRRQCGTGW